MGAGVVVVGILVGCVYFLGSGTNASVAEGANVIESANAANQGSIWVSIKSTTVSGYNFIYNHTVGYFYPAQVVDQTDLQAPGAVGHISPDSIRGTGLQSPVSSDSEISMSRDFYFPKPGSSTDLSQSLTPRASQAVVDVAKQVGPGSTTVWSGDALPTSTALQLDTGVDSAAAKAGSTSSAVAGGSSVVRQELVVKTRINNIRVKKFSVRNFSSSPVLFANRLEDDDIYELDVFGFLTQAVITQFVEGL